MFRSQPYSGNSREISRMKASRYVLARTDAAAMAAKVASPTRRASGTITIRAPPKSPASALRSERNLTAQLEKEQQRTEELLEELKRVKSSDAAEIMRLKKELATLRKVLQSFVHQIDSLNRLNEELTQENSNLKTQNQQAQQHISNLSSQNESLSSKVEIASQLDATGIWAEGRNKKGKAAKKIKDVKKFVIGFRIARNVTTSTGIRSIYLRISTPTGDVLTKGGTFQYENRNLEYSIRKDIEYTGEEQSVQVYWDVAEALSAGTYRVDIFADGHNIGTSSFSFEK